MAQRLGIACILAKPQRQILRRGTPVYLNEHAKVRLSSVFAEIFAAFGTRPNRTIPDAELAH